MPALPHAENRERVRRRAGKFRTAPQQEPFDTQDPRRRFAGDVANSHGATAKTFRHARSPQTVRTAPQREPFDTHDPADGSPATLRIRTAPQRDRFDTHDPCRGLAGKLANSQSAIFRSFRHARSPQRFAGELEIRTAPQQERFDTHNPRRGVHPAYPRQTQPRPRNERSYTKGCVGYLVCEVPCNGVRAVV